MNLPPLREKINNESCHQATPGMHRDNPLTYPTTTGPVTMDQQGVVPQYDEAITVNADNPLVKFDVQQAALDLIKTFQSLKVDVENPKTVKEVKAAKKKTRDLRLKIQRREKELDANLVKKRKDLKSEAGSIVRGIKETENHLISEIKKDTDHKAKLVEEARIAEEARLDKLAENMRILGNHCESGLLNGLTAEQIQEKLKLLNETIIPKEIFQEKYQAACDLLGHAVESTTERLAARKNFEEEEAKRVAEMAVLKEQQEINDQNSWFNANFSWNSTLDGMEKSLELLEKSTFAEHLKSLVEQQKDIAEGIIVGARAKKAEEDRLAQEKADREAKEKAEKDWNEAWDEAHAMNEAWDKEQRYLLDWDDAIATNTYAPIVCKEFPEGIKVVTDNEELPPTNSDPDPEPAEKTFEDIVDKGLESYSTRKPQPLDDAATIRTLFLGIKGAFSKPTIQDPNAYRVWVMLDEHMKTMEKHVVEYLKPHGVKYDL